MKEDSIEERKRMGSISKCKIIFHETNNNDE
jgi:hypothetical protein